MKNDNSKVLSRLNKVYRTQQNWYYNKVYKFATWLSGETKQRCESITDFLKNVKYAKLLKKTRVPYRSKMGQIEQHQKNKHSRVEAKQQIKEGIQEYEQDKEIYTCASCIYCEDTYCHKHQKFLESDLPTCNYFVD